MDQAKKGGSATVTSAQRWAIPMITGSTLLISVNGLIIRSIESANEWQIILYRQLFFVPALLLVLAYQYRTRLPGLFCQVGWAGLGAAVSLGLANPIFIVAMSHTTVANALFTISSAPLITAVLARVFLKEKITRPTFIAVLIAMSGIAVMVGDGFISGAVFGNLLALLCAFFFSIFVICLRIGKDRNMLPASVLGGILAGLIGLIGSGFDMQVSARDISICFLWGAVIVTTVHYFFTLGSRYVAGTEIMLITLIEFTLGPVWVWMVFGETPTRMALFGGIMVLSAVAYRAVTLLYQERRSAARTAGP
ncbi:MAG: DMT family transporter [Arenicellales bacterium]|nr:DMT family transporter [Arenicellales bacterium]